MLAKRDFTDRFLKAIKPASEGKRVIIYDSAVKGFGIRVTDKSSEDNRGAFVLVTRFPGSSNPTPRRIGDYPAMTLSTARDIAREWREDIRKGVDPRDKEAARLREDQRRRADTFAAAFDAFAADHLSTLRTGAGVKAAVEKRLYPAWRDRPISEIKRADINEVIRSIRKDAPIAANRMLAYLKKFFGWALDQDLIEASPAVSIKRPTKETRRDRVLTETEIKAIWAGCTELGVFGKAFQLMLVTGQRRSEVGGMAWTEIDHTKANWTLARERTKADRAHEVPLSATAMEIIEACPKLGHYVLATNRSAAESKGSQGTQISGWSKAKSQLDDIVVERTGGPLPAWHLHDLRRTCATYLAQLGVDRVVISKVLNHAEDGVTGIYDRHRYNTEKRQALTLWSAHLSTITSRALCA